MQGRTYDRNVGISMAHYVCMYVCIYVLLFPTPKQNCMIHLYFRDFGGLIQKNIDNIVEMYKISQEFNLLDNFCKILAIMLTAEVVMFV